MNDDVLTRNENQELAVRTVSVTEGSNASSYDDVFTRDTNGKLAVRVVGNGGGGGDSHNLGYYETPEALRTAHPTATAGDFAIVNSTDTVWLWDTDTSSWKDGDTKGQVTSVNNQTGAVTLTASDVGALPDNTHIPADPVQADWDEADSSALDYIKNKPTIPAAQVNSDWDAVSGVAQILNKPTLATVATTGQYSDLIGKPTIPDPTQVSTLPTASADELGKIYQFVGTTDANYTNGYFYKCVSDGATPAVYSWTAIEVQAGGGSSYTAGTGIDITSGVISVTAPTLVNNSNTNGNLAIKATADGTQTVAIGENTYTKTIYGTVVGYNNRCQKNSDNAYMTAFGSDNTITNPCALALGNRLTVTANYAIQIGYHATNSDANTFKVANVNGNYEMMSADGTIPTARLTKVNSTITLTAADWSSNSQTVNVTGMTADGVVMVSPDPTDQSAYTSAGVLCTAQAAGTLTFTCDTVPSADIDVNVVML